MDQIIYVDSDKFTNFESARFPDNCGVVRRTKRFFVPKGDYTCEQFIALGGITKTHMPVHSIFDILGNNLYFIGGIHPIRLSTFFLDTPFYVMLLKSDLKLAFTAKEDTNISFKYINYSPVAVTNILEYLNSIDRRTNHFMFSISYPRGSGSYSICSPGPAPKSNVSRSIQFVPTNTPEDCLYKHDWDIVGHSGPSGPTDLGREAIPSSCSIPTVPVVTKTYNYLRTLWERSRQNILTNYMLSRPADSFSFEDKEIYIERPKVSELLEKEKSDT